MNPSIRPETLRPAEHWLPPTGEEIAEVVRLIGVRRGAPFTGAMVAKYLGLSGGTGTGNGSRTYRRWVMEGGIPYSAWALLCLAAGLGCIALPDDESH